MPADQGSLPRRLAAGLRDGGAGAALFFSVVQISVQSLVLFLTYRIAVQEIGLASLGLWSVASAAASFGRVGDLGFAGALPRLLAQGLVRAGEPGARQQTASLVETAVLSSTAGTLILTAIMTYPLILFARQVAPSADHAMVNSLVLGANVSLLAAALSITFLACHDGIGNFRFRAFVAISGNLVNLAVLWLMIGRVGALALPLAVTIQGVWAAGLAWLGLRRCLPGLSPFPFAWSKLAFRELLSIGKFTQTNSILIMLFEPLSRVLAGRLGGAEFAALFDLAARVAGNVRLLFSSSTQAMVPFYAFVRNSADRTRVLFEASTCAIAVLAAGVMALAGMASPLLSLLALNAIRLDFLVVFWILLAGNLVSIVGGPAFSYSLGAGQASVTTRAFLLQAATFIICTFAIFPIAGGTGVSAAYGLALAIPGIYLASAGPRLDDGVQRKLIAQIIRAVVPILLIFIAAVGAAALPNGQLTRLLPVLLPIAAFVAVADLGLRFGRPLLRWGREVNGFRIATGQSRAA